MINRNNRFIALVLAAVSVLWLAPVLSAEIKLPAVIGDHMVVQQDKPVAFWGWAGKNEQVTVRFGWHQLAVPNLANKEGLPASPFRTDRW